MKLVLDTNIALDWLVFRDPGVAELQAALDRGRVEIVTHQPAIDELRRVLGYSEFELGIDQQQAVLERYSSQSRLIALPDGFHLNNLGLPVGFPHCRDRDDQHFFALAYHEREAALVSKDTAVLELTKRVRKFGVTVLDPKQLAAALTIT